MRGVREPCSTSSEGLGQTVISVIPSSRAVWWPPGTSQRVLQASGWLPQPSRSSQPATANHALLLSARSPTPSVCLQALPTPGPTLGFPEHRSLPSPPVEYASYPRPTQDPDPASCSSLSALCPLPLTCRLASQPSFLRRMPARVTRVVSLGPTPLE